MAATDSILGTCPACGTALVKSRKKGSRDPFVSIPAEDPPPNAYYPELGFSVRVVWCPACGWVRQLEAPQIGLAWTNDEYERRGS